MANTFRIDVEIVTRLLRLCWPFFRSVELTFYGQVAFCFIYISCVVFIFRFLWARRFHILLFLLMSI